MADEKTVMFGPLVIQYDPDGLAPRAWTQLQSHWAAELLGELPEGDVLELGAGPGQIGLLALVEADAGSDALSRRRRRRRLVQVDEDQAACGLAERNAAAAELTDRVDVRCGVAEDALHPDERFALVIADPPWVRTDRVDDYPDDPPPAIDGGPDGLDVVRSLLPVIERHLRPSGAALLQVGGPDQVRQVRVILEDTGSALGVLDSREAPGADDGAVALLRRG